MYGGGRARGELPFSFGALRVGGWSSWRGGREERGLVRRFRFRANRKTERREKEKMPKMTVGAEKSVEQRLLLPFLRADEGRINVYEESRKR